MILMVRYNVFLYFFSFIIKQTIGESAGGNLAAAITARNYDLDYVSLEDRIPINGLLLIYPPLSCQFNTQIYVNTLSCQFNTIMSLLSVGYMDFGIKISGSGTAIGIF